MNSPSEGLGSFIRGRSSGNQPVKDIIAVLPPVERLDAGVFNSGGGRHVTFYLHLRNLK